MNFLIATSRKLVIHNHQILVIKTGSMVLIFRGEIYLPVSGVLIVV